MNLIHQHHNDAYPSMLSPLAKDRFLSTNKHHEYIIIDAKGENQLDSNSSVQLPYALMYEEHPNILLIQKAVGNRWKYGYMDIHGKIRCTPKFYQATPFIHNIAFVRDSSTNLYAIIDTNFQQISDFEYQEYEQRQQYTNFLSVKKNYKWGVINIRTGEAILPTVHDELQPFFLGRAMVKKDGKWGVVDTTGRVILDYQYHDMPFYWRNDTYVACQNGQCGLVGNGDTILLPFQYARLYLHNMPQHDDDNYLYPHLGYMQNYHPLSFLGYQIPPDVHEDWLIATSADNQKTGIITHQNDTIIPLEYDYIRSFSEGLSVVTKIHNKKHLHGAIDTNNHLIIPIIYTSLQLGEDDLHIATKGKRFGIINSQNKVILPFEYQGIHLRYGGFDLQKNNTTTSISKAELNMNN